MRRVGLSTTFLQIFLQVFQQRDFAKLFHVQWQLQSILSAFQYQFSWVCVDLAVAKMDGKGKVFYRRKKISGIETHAPMRQRQSKCSTLLA